ncbi:MAG TPA: hypothetical protein VEU33_01570 [Archangium sp.]|nr:hypothetical protein [Archangium sp.]
MTPRRWISPSVEASELASTKTGGKAHLELADRFGRLVEPRSLFFDWGFAKTGGVAGVGAARVAGVARRHGGWAVLGAALLGGVLAGLLGKGARVNTAEELKRVVAEPLLEDSLRRLKEATRSAHADVERWCGLLRKVAELFSPEHARAYDVERLGHAVTEAEGRREQFRRELTELQWKDARVASRRETVPGPGQYQEGRGRPRASV